jgi:hypothetical protein
VKNWKEESKRNMDECRTEGQRQTSKTEEKESKKKRVGDKK